MEDDPDRTSMPAPKFSFVNSDCKSRHAELEVEQIQFDWRQNTDVAFALHNILTKAECEEIIAATKDKKFTPALLNIGRGRQVMFPDRRDGWRCIIDSKPLSTYLFNVAKPHLPDVRCDAKLSDMNERCRFLYYLPGQVFPPHCDGRYTRPRGHPDAGAYSQLTFQLYLNDMAPKDGGATTFTRWGGRKRVPFYPRQGSALIFSQNLEHEGSLVEGNEKFTMRSEFMYSPLPKGPQV